MIFHIFLIHECISFIWSHYTNVDMLRLAYLVQMDLDMGVVARKGSTLELSE